MISRGSLGFPSLVNAVLDIDLHGYGTYSKAKIVTNLHSEALLQTIGLIHHWVPR